MFFLLHSLWRRNCDEVNPFCHIQEDQSDLGNYVFPVFVQQGAFISAARLRAAETHTTNSCESCRLNNFYAYISTKLFQKHVYCKHNINYKLIKK